MSALIAVVVLAVVLPLAGASAGPAGSFDAGAVGVRGEGASRSEVTLADGVKDEGLRAEGVRTGDARAEGLRTGDARAEPATRPGDARAGNAPQAEGVRAGGSVAVGEPEPAAGEEPDHRRTEGAPGLLSGLGLATLARCGPELASPEGVEAQTCVLSQGGDTWARTYYRNATGEELSAVLTLMGPGGRTVRMHCVVGQGDEPGACGTPREPTAGEPEAYSAVAEFAALAEPGEKNAAAGRLLLRVGSNTEPRTGS